MAVFWGEMLLMLWRIVENLLWIMLHWLHVILRAIQAWLFKLIKLVLGLKKLLICVIPYTACGTWIGLQVAARLINLRTILLLVKFQLTLISFILFSYLLWLFLYIWGILVKILWSGNVYFFYVKLWLFLFALILLNMIPCVYWIVFQGRIWRESNFWALKSCLTLYNTIFLVCGLLILELLSLLSIFYHLL